MGVFMLRIAICDDIRDERDLVAEYTKEYFSSIGTEMQTDIYDNMIGLLETEKEYDLYLLDVLMPGMTGIEGAAELQRRMKDPRIVFITSSIDAAVDGYGVNACGFLLKPLQFEKYVETMERIRRKYLDKGGRTITITYKKVEVGIDTERILYVENKLHTINIVLDNGMTYTIGAKLSDFQEQLIPAKHFLRCHQSYIVNLKAVKDMDATGFILQDGSYVPVSRSNYKTCKTALYRFKLQ